MHWEKRVRDDVGVLPHMTDKGSCPVKAPWAIPFSSWAPQPRE